MKRADYVKSIREIDRKLKQTLFHKRAIDIISADDYIAYLKKDNNGFVAEVWSWGRRHPDIKADSVKELKEKIHSTYDLHG